MDFTFVGSPESETFGWFSRGLREVMESQGHRHIDETDGAKLVFNFFPGAARPSGAGRRPCSYAR